MTLDQARRAFGDAAHQAGPVAREAIVKATEECLTAIQSDWPVKTGRSLDGWRSSSTRTGADLSNPVDYTSQVHGGLADRLVQDCFAQAEQGTTRAIESKITRTLGGR